MRTRLMRGKFTLLFMMLGLLLAVPAIAFAQDSTVSTLPAALTIQSDKADYAPGELVTLTGGGWQPGESVHINVNDTYGATWSRNVDVIADASGNITDSFNLPNSFVSDYDVTATGALSGTATTTFTDNPNPNSLTVNPSSAEVTRGNNAIYTATVGFGGNNSGNCTVSLSASPLSNATATFNPTSNTSNSTGDFNSTLTVGTTANPPASRTPLGSQTFTVTMTRGALCNGSGNLTQQGTLVVNPRAPSGLTATANGSNSINLSWAASPDENDITKYVVFEGTTEVASTANNTTRSVSINGLAAGSTHTYTVKARYTANSTNYDSAASNSSTATTAAADSTAPTVSSINRANANPTNASSVGWNVTFSESVTGVDSSDFTLANTGLTGPGSINVTGSGANYSVTANTGTGSGTLGLNLNDNDSIADAAGNKLGGTGTGTAGGGGTGNGSFTGEVYTIDRTAANVTLTNVNGAARTFPYLTNQDVASLGGSCEPGGSPVNVTRNGGPTSPALAPCSPSGSWTLNLITPVSTDGVHNFAASQNDAAGNAGSSGNKPVQIDKTAPVISRDSVKSGTLGLNGWYTTDVGYGFTASDGPNGSGLAAADQAFTKNITTEGPAQNVSSGTVKDLAGRVATAIDSPDFKIDKTDPVISRDSVKSGTLGLNNWYTTDVGYGFTASDPNGTNGSGLAAADQAFTKTTTGEGSAIHVSSGTVKDLAGRVATAVDSPDFKIDKTAPTLAPTVNPNPVQLYGSATVTANPSDGTLGSGVNLASVSCGSVDASSVTAANTSRSVSCSASDNAGLSSTKSVSYTVVYGTMFSGVLQPINLGTQRSIFKLGSTIPVKFKLMNGTQPISGAVANLSVQKQDSTVEGAVNEDVLTDTPTPGNTFRYDATGQQYILNLSTKNTYTNLDGKSVNFSAGTWVLTIKLDDGTTRTATIDIGR